VKPVDRRAILRSYVGALAHALSRVMRLPEVAQQLLVADLRRVECYENGLGVARRAGADFLVGRVRRVAAGVADRRRVHAGQLPEDSLSAPKAAHREDRLLDALGKRRAQRGPEYLVALGHGHLPVVTGERPLGVDHLRLVLEEHLGEPVHRRPPAAIGIAGNRHFASEPREGCLATLYLEKGMASTL